MNKTKLPLNERILLPLRSHVYQLDDGKFLNIFPDMPNWIVLEKSEQEAYELLMNSELPLIDLINNRPANKLFIPRIIKKLLERGILQYESPNLEIDMDIVLHVYLTQQCQLRCKHCYSSSAEKRQNELTGKEWVKVIGDYVKHGGYKVQLSGGETLLYEDLELVLNSLIEHKKNGVELVFLTNGLLLDIRKAELLNKSTNVIKISIDGASKETHEYIRGKSTFNKVKAAILCLSDYEGKIIIQMSLWPNNFDDDLYNLEQFISEIKSLHKNIEILVNIASFRGREIDYLERSALESYDKKLRDHLNIPDGKTVRNRRVTHCGYGNKIAINSDGEVKPCALGGETIGNVRSVPIQELKRKCYDIIENEQVSNLGGCSTCDFRYVCGGFCRVAGQEINDPLSKVLCSLEFKKLLVERLAEIDV